MATLHRYGLAQGPGDEGSAGWAGGKGRGVTESDWPRYDDAPMQHVITVRREAIGAPLPEDVAAVAVFIADLGDNEAFEPETEESAVRFLSADALAKPSWEGAPDGAEPHHLVVDRVEYSFDADAKFDDDETPKPEAELDEENRSWAMGDFMSARAEEKVDGHPIAAMSAPHVQWVQAIETPEDQAVLFWMYDDMLEGTNFGCGTLYVSAAADGSAGAAWWQC